jgi:hypothetical protein
VPIKSAPVVHSVHFYDGEQALITRLRGVVATGLEMGNSVLIVATEEHRRELAKALTKRGVDMASYERKGVFVACDARETLATFMVDGRPDRARFLSSVGTLLADAKRAARSSGQGLTVFGEMVAVLWEEGNRIAAFELETFWNDLLNDRAFHLHCAYPRSGFAPRDHDGMAAICDVHSHVIGESRPLLH